MVLGARAGRVHITDIAIQNLRVYKAFCERFGWLVVSQPTNGPAGWLEDACGVTWLAPIQPTVSQPASSWKRASRRLASCWPATGSEPAGSWQRASRRLAASQ
eukprot:113648-Chlamydomonas_euryale.AAC.7